MLLLFSLLFLSAPFNKVKSISAADETEIQQATVMTSHRLAPIYISQAHCLESYFTFY